MKWTREQIIRAILKREAAGLPLNTGHKGVEFTLYQAGARAFGSWRNAVMAAGVCPDRAFAHDQWSPAKILATIRTLARRGRPRRKELKRRFELVMKAAARTFGSWPKAVIAAGVDPIKFRRVSLWTRDRIVEAILVRVLKNEPLGSTTVRPQSLAEAAVREFGSWGGALAAAGLDPKRYMGEAPHSDRSAMHVSPGDTQESVILVGENSLAPLGPRQCWSRETVCQAILVRLREHRPMNASAVCADDKSLYRASRKRFGSWRDALRAAGLNPAEFRRYGGGHHGARRPPSRENCANGCLSDAAS
jgi:hypothetical protein